MRIFARAIQIIRWIDNTADGGFSLQKASSEALTVDLFSLNQEISVYEVKSPEDIFIEKIAIKVFIDCLRNFNQGITLYLFEEEYLVNNGFIMEEAPQDNPFGLIHFNVTKIEKGDDLFEIANHIGDSIKKETAKVYDYLPKDIYRLICKHIDECKKYSKFNSRKKDLRNYFSSIIENTEVFD